MDTLFNGHQTFSGRTLKPHGIGGLTGHWVSQFLELWERDATSAVMFRASAMADRDSHHGDYLALIVSNGTIERDELEQACVCALQAWSKLSAEARFAKDQHFMLGFAEIASCAVATRPALTAVQDWFVENFTEQWGRSDQWSHCGWKLSLLGAVVSAPTADRLRSWALRKVTEPDWQFSADMAQLAFWDGDLF